MARCFTSTYAKCDSETDDPARDDWTPMGWGLGLAPGEKWPTSWRCRACMGRLLNSMLEHLQKSIGQTPPGRKLDGGSA